MSRVQSSAKMRTTRTIAMLGALGLLSIAVIQVPSLADQWDELQNQFEEQRRRQAGQDQPAGRAHQLREQLRQTESDLATLNASMIDSSLLPNVQSELIDLLRSSGCQIRKVAIQAGSTEAWETQAYGIDDTPGSSLTNPPLPLADPAVLEEGQTNYTLNTEQISLSLDGTLDQVSQFLHELRQKPWTMRIAQANFSHMPDDQGRLTVETTLEFLRLSASQPQL